jgi:hypothetical protein
VKENEAFIEFRLRSNRICFVLLMQWCVESMASKRLLNNLYSSMSVYAVFIVQAYQTSQYVVPSAAAFFSASGAALSQEVPTVK